MIRVRNQCSLFLCRYKLNYENGVTAGFNTPFSWSLTSYIS